MTVRASILLHEGAQDGIRWGRLLLTPGGLRRFHHDRLTGACRLYTHANQHDSASDDDPAHIAAALEALAREPR